MNIIEKISNGSSILLDGKSYSVLGKGYYVTQTDTNSMYAKILLNDHYVLVISPSDNIAYFGQNKGRLSEFDRCDSEIVFNGKKFIKVNEDYQIMVKLSFGSPLEVEGEVVFWDYEFGDEIISVAVVSRTKERADVVGRYIKTSDIQII